MTVLFLTASTLASYKVVSDLHAFEPKSRRIVDLFAFLVLGIFIILLALAMPGQSLPPIEPCWEHVPCDYTPM